MDFNLGSSVIESIAQPFSTNCYTFSAMKGDRVKIQMSEIDEAIGPFMEIYEPDGKMMAFADSDGCKHRAAQLNLLLSKTGVYRVQCRDRGDAVGRYAISMIMIPDRTSSSRDPDIGHVKPWERKDGTIDNPGDFDAATFNGKAGTRVVIRMDEVDASLEPYLQLYDPKGRCMASAKSSSPYRIAILEADLSENGTYTILCQDRFINTGRYLLIMDQSSPSAVNAPAAVATLP
jgi:hypothetical protein